MEVKEGIITKQSFEMISVLGKGAYGKVVLVRKKSGHDKGQLFAMKILKKAEITKLNQVPNTITERKVLAMCDHPFIIKLHYAFQNQEKLNYVLEYCPGGELFFYLQQIGRFKESAVKFYAANILMAFNHLHSKNVLYRDLKPENVLVDQDGYLKLTDFGLSSFEGDAEPENTLTGTAEYISPELLQGINSTRASDWWSFGVIVYEMLTGLPPFMHKKREKLYQQIKYCEPKVDYPYLSSDVRDLLQGLLRKDPSQRLVGLNVMSHPWFADIDFDRLVAKQLKAPFKPKLDCGSDLRYFSNEFTDMKMSPENSQCSKEDEKQKLSFQGFEYNDKQSCDFDLKFE